MSKEQSGAVAVKKSEKEISERVLSKINQLADTGQLIIPRDYSPENALKAAYLYLIDKKVDSKGSPNHSKGYLEVCTTESVGRALLKMCLEGLSVVKGQGYFIPYGDELTWIRSYQGSKALAKRVGGVLDIVPNVIYQGDSFSYRINTESGYKELIEHIPSIDNIDNAKIKGAYAIITYTDGRKDLEVMTIAEIRQAWQQGYGKGNTGAHNNFTQEMCKKTVINRAAKGPINSSSDANLFEEQEDSNKQYLAPDDEIKGAIEAGTASEAFEEAVTIEGDSNNNQATDGPGF